MGKLREDDGEEKDESNRSMMVWGRTRGKRGQEITKECSEDPVTRGMWKGFVNAHLQSSAMMIREAVSILGTAWALQLETRVAAL
ncbi:uncharacterized protein [Macaca fascicularis]|uniref:uncharacterized protein n=1 Tax=Macaca fascicularis TaxID=9541 RepID=UPI0032B0704C